MEEKITAAYRNLNLEANHSGPNKNPAENQKAKQTTKLHQSPSDP